MVSEKNDLKHVLALLKTVQKSVIHVRQHPDRNDTFDIMTSEHITDADRPDPLRIPEVLIVVSVLLLWCGSIFIFIRHSELLRIRHRDLPFRSTIKSPSSPATNLNHITVITCGSDMNIHTKSLVSSTGGLTPPANHTKFQHHRHADMLETISLIIPSSVKQRRHTHSFDFALSTLIKNQPAKHEDREHLLHPGRVTLDTREDSRQLQRKSFENLSAMKCSAFHSTNDMSREKISDAKTLFGKKRCASESPV